MQLIRPIINRQMWTLHSYKSTQQILLKVNVYKKLLRGSGWRKHFYNKNIETSLFVYFNRKYELNFAFLKLCAGIPIRQIESDMIR